VRRPCGGWPPGPTGRQISWVTDVRQVAAPALFHIQWDDEIFPRNGQLALFDLLGSPEKELTGYAGPHAETKPAAITRWREFVARRLVPSA
jgi:hypothetical protein